MKLKEIKIEDLDLNVFTSLAKDYALVSAGDKEKYNTMTVSWGGLGVLWGEPVATIYIRPTRYTKEFIDRHDRFTLTFFNGYKKELGVLGSVSGRDRDKIKEVDFHVTFLNETPTFQEGKIVFVCKKLYYDTIKPELFFDDTLDTKWYPLKDYHTLYMAKIEHVYVKDESI